jgi:hypothetical protein
MYKQLDDDYLTAIWKSNLESQLLWYVVPWFEGSHFRYKSKRAKVYRAPSFSWAAINAPDALRCGNITNEGLHVKVLSVQVQPKDDQNPFGLVKERTKDIVNLMISSRFVKRIQLSNPLDLRGVARCKWRLIAREDIEGARHRNVYLDSPNSDNLLPVICSPFFDEIVKSARG